MLNFPLLCPPEDAAGIAQARALLDAAKPLTFWLHDELPPSPERDLAMQGLSAAVLYAHQAILRAGAVSRVLIASAGQQ